METHPVICMEAIFQQKPLSEMLIIIFTFMLVTAVSVLALT